MIFRHGNLTIFIVGHGNLCQSKIVFHTFVILPRGTALRSSCTARIIIIGTNHARSGGRRQKREGKQRSPALFNCGRPVCSLHQVLHLPIQPAVHGAPAPVRATDISAYATSRLNYGAHSLNLFIACELEYFMRL